jgi:transcriptional regulator with XRE-family HTH domain
MQVRTPQSGVEALSARESSRPIGSFLIILGRSRYTAGMESDSLDSGIDSETRRLADLLDHVVRLSKRSRRSLESDLGLGSSGLSKILKGTIRLQVSHVLSVLEALQVDPYDFFRVAYGRRRLEKSPLIEQLRALVEPEREKETAKNGKRPAGGELPDFEDRVRQVLLKLLSEGARETS